MGLNSVHVFLCFACCVLALVFARVIAIGFRAKNLGVSLQYFAAICEANSAAAAFRNVCTAWGIRCSHRLLLLVVILLTLHPCTRCVRHPPKVSCATSRACCCGHRRLPLKGPLLLLLRCCWIVLCVCARFACDSQSVKPALVVCFFFIFC